MTEGSYDTCELNYSHTIYVAELFNTLSSLPLIFLSYWGSRKLRYADGELLWQATFFALGLVGFGSCIAHCFLYPSWLDELPLFYVFFLFLQCISSSFPNHLWPKTYLQGSFEVAKGVRVSYFNFCLYLSTIVSTVLYCYESTRSIYMFVYTGYIVLTILWSIQASVHGSMIVRELYCRFALVCFIGCLSW